MCRSPTSPFTVLEGSMFTSMPKWVKIWSHSMRKGPSSGVCGDGQWTGTMHRCLPTELFLQIAVFAASTSQEAYCNFSLVSKCTRSTIERHALPSLPIRLESTASIMAFHHLIVRSRPELAQRVRHLWIRGARSKHKHRGGYSGPTSSAWRKVKASAFEQLQIITRCTRLVSLACSFPILFLCFLPSTREVFVQHDQLRDLTLFENWNLWDSFSLDPTLDGPHLFLQLTHLTILDSVAPRFPTRLFPSLHCFAAEIRPKSSHGIIQALKTNEVLHAPLPRAIHSLPKEVDIALVLVDQTDMGTKRVVSADGRTWKMHVGTPRYFQWWSDRV